MGSLPAATVLDFASNPDADVAAGYLAQILEFVRQNIGGAAQGALTLASDACTPTVAAFTIDTEGAAATDDCKTIAVTNFPDGSWIFVSSADASRVPTLKHGTGNLLLRDGAGCDLVLYNPLDVVAFQRIGSNFVERFRSTQNRLARVRALTANTTLVVSDSGSIITNTAAGGDLDHALPAAAPGVSYRVRLTTAHKIKVHANGTDVIRAAGTVSAGGGNTEMAAVAGNWFDIECNEAGKWFVTGSVGTLTTT